MKGSNLNIYYCFFGSFLLIFMHSTVVQSMALLYHSKTVPGSNPLTQLVSGFELCGVGKFSLSLQYSSLLPQSKDMQVRLTGDSMYESGQEGLTACVF